VASNATAVLLLVLAVATAAPLAAAQSSQASPFGGKAGDASAADPVARAGSAYAEGLKRRIAADKKAAAALDPGAGAKRRDKARAAAAEGYSGALGQLGEALRLDPRMHQAWNESGYCHSRLGRLTAAIEAYDAAIALKPGYPDAVANRAEAYLDLNRPEEAQRAYDELFASDRPLAERLLASMRAWLSARRVDPQGVGTAELDATAAWITARSTLSR
jgi:tetratricopeptide (TPR) repeat protein